MLYFIDTEFITNPLSLISVGVISASGKEFYTECEAPLHMANAFVRKNVIPQLEYKPGSARGAPRACDVVDAFGRFIRSTCPDKPQFVGYYCAYDAVVLQQMFGDFENWPLEWPFLWLDLAQILLLAGGPHIDEKHAGEHHALEDARWTAKLYYDMSAGQLCLFDGSRTRFDRTLLGRFCA